MAGRHVRLPDGPACCVSVAGTALPNSACWVDGCALAVRRAGTLRLALRSRIGRWFVSMESCTDGAPLYIAPRESCAPQYSWTAPHRGGRAMGVISASSFSGPSENDNQSVPDRLSDPAAAL